MLLLVKNAVFDKCCFKYIVKVISKNAVHVVVVVKVVVNECKLSTDN